VFRHEGPSRSHRNNEILAAYLAVTAGFVNAVGFTLLGAFTSHVTGNFGRVGDDLARNDVPAAWFAVALVAAFVVGSFTTTMILNTPRRRVAYGYGIALAIEATLLFAFVFAPSHETIPNAREVDLQASLLCVAMGMQNSLVTRLSGAVVRTTHLTGVLTDLGIEAAHWWRWLFRGAKPGIERPGTERSLLLATIVAGFAVGTVLGAVGALHWGRWAVLFPAMAVVAAAAQAFASETSRLRA